MNHDIPIGTHLSERFAIVPDWVADSAISDGALRLYIVLYQMAFRDSPNSILSRSRRQLAKALRVRSLDVITRRLAELENIGAVSVERGEWTQADGYPENRYTIHTSRPSSSETTSSPTTTTPSSPTTTTPSSLSS